MSILAKKFGLVARATLSAMLAIGLMPTIAFAESTADSSPSVKQSDDKLTLYVRAESGSSSLSVEKASAKAALATYADTAKGTIAALTGLTPYEIRVHQVNVDVAETNGDEVIDAASSGTDVLSALSSAKSTIDGVVDTAKSAESAKHVPVNADFDVVYPTKYGRSDQATEMYVSYNLDTFPLSSVNSHIYDAAGNELNNVFKAGTYRVTVDVAVNEKTTGVTGLELGTFTIAKREVIMTSDSGSKTYDGKPLAKYRVIVTGDDFLIGEGATYDITGSQTDIGTSDNTFTYTLKDGTDPSNYDITVVYGKLTVEPSTSSDYEPSVGSDYEPSVGSDYEPSAPSVGSEYEPSTPATSESAVSDSDAAVINVPAEQVVAGSSLVVADGAAKGTKLKIVDPAAEGKAGTLQFSAPAEGTKNLVVPGSVVINGTEYAVTSVAPRACEGDVVLESAVLPNSVTAIGSAAFAGCTRLSRVTLGAAVTKIGTQAFKGDKCLKTLKVKSKKLTKAGVKNALKGSSVTKVKVPKVKLKAYRMIFTKANCGKKVVVAKL